MLEVIALEEAYALVRERFDPLVRVTRSVPLGEALGRRVAHDVVAAEGVPAFDRSTVDGYAVIAADTFGCSEALPALLTLKGEVAMGAVPDRGCFPGTCIRIPTGGQVPEGANAVVMLEYCEEYGDGTVGIAKPVAPGDNMVFKNDDVAPGQVLVSAGTILEPHHIGTLASLGTIRPEVLARPIVGIISTGDEIVAEDEAATAAQMRDVNAPVLAGACAACGALVERFPIVADDLEALRTMAEQALKTCDVVLISGGSSAGQRDNTARVLGDLGTLLFHGVAVKPGKPTLCADVNGKPVFGLPGHPVAAYFMFLELVRPLLRGYQAEPPTVTARLATGVPSNNGRTEFVAARLERRDENVFAEPAHGKSGLISQLAGAHGYFAIGRNQEGLPAGASVEVRLF